MHFEISRALKAGKALTRAQLSSSHFAEEPRIGARTLRRWSSPLKLSRAEFDLSIKDISKGLLSQSIVVSAFEDGTKIGESTSWDMKNNKPEFVWTLVPTSSGFVKPKEKLDVAAEAAKIEAEVQALLDSGKETLETLQAEVVPPPEAEKDFLDEVVEERTAENPDFPKMVEEAAKRKGRKAKKEQE